MQWFSQYIDNSNNTYFHDGFEHGKNHVMQQLEFLVHFFSDTFKDLISNNDIDPDEDLFLTTEIFLRSMMLNITREQKDYFKMNLRHDDPYNLRASLCKRIAKESLSNDERLYSISLLEKKLHEKETELWNSQLNLSKEIDRAKQDLINAEMINKFNLENKEKQIQFLEKKIKNLENIVSRLQNEIDGVN